MAILKFQRALSEERLAKVHKRETDAIDEEMHRVPNEPKDFAKWVENIALMNSRYIYYRYGSRITEGYCTHCGKIVPLSEKPGNNKSGTCKLCRSRVTYKAWKKAGKIEDNTEALLLQRLNDGRFVLRSYRAKKCYEKPREDANSIKTEFRLHEDARLVLDEEMRPRKRYVYDIYKSTHQLRWCNSSYGWSNYYTNGYLYTYNLNEILKATKMEYVPLSKLLVTKRHWFHGAVEALRRMAKNANTLEYFIKCRLYSLAIELMENDYLTDSATLNIWGKNIIECLMISKEQLKILQKIDGNKKDLIRMQVAKKNDIRLTEEQYRFFHEHNVDYEIIQYMKGTTPAKMFRYLQSLRKGERKETEKKIREYRDYLQMRDNCGYNMSDLIILYPKDLDEAHKKMVLETNSKELDIRIRKVNRDFCHIADHFQTLNELYQYEDGDYLIRPAQDAGEIVMEGRFLHHCVGGDGYLRKHDRLDSIILFLRKKEEPDTPYYTIELREEKVVQFYSEYDKQPDKEKIKKWLDKWLEAVKNRKLKEEVRIAI